MHVSVMEERAEVLEDFPAAANRVVSNPVGFIAGRDWQSNDALMLVSRNYELDQEALASALAQEAIAYIGMIGSRRKVRCVFEALKERGIATEKLARVYSPLGLDIGADSPTEIAISALAELLKVQRGRNGEHLRGRS